MENKPTYLIIEGQKPYMNSNFIKEFGKILEENNQSYQIIEKWRYTEYLGEDDIYTLINFGINEWVQAFNKKRNVKYILLNTSILASKIIMDLKANQEYITKKHYGIIIEKIRKYREILKPRKVIYMEYSGLERNEEYEQRLRETYGEYTKIVDIRKNTYINQGLYIYNEIKKITRRVGYVAGLLYTKEGNVYLSRRENRSKPYWKSYQSIGGNIENNEIPEQTCIRKIREESGIQIGEEQIKYIGQYEENEIRRTCDLYMIKIGGFQKPRSMGIMRNTIWYKMTGKQMYEKRLIPVYEHFKKEILEELGYKYED